MTRIEWCDRTWNPAVGCTRVSAGCDRCYAARVASRGLSEAHRGLATAGQWNGDVRLFPERLDEPLRWRKPSRVFVGSMTDLFHPAVPDGFIVRVLATIYGAPQHTFQVLTKRQLRMAEFMRRWADRSGDGDVAPMPVRRTPDEIRAAYTSGRAHLWAAHNELLGPVDLYGYVEPDWIGGPGGGSGARHPLLDWVIVGGETGPGTRKMEIGWAEDLVGQCRVAGVAVFVKQLGSWCGPRHKEFDRFPASLQVREFPERVA